MSISKYTKELGNDKPKLLLDIEKLIWKIVLDMSWGNKDVRTALSDFLTAVPWDEIHNLGDKDVVRHWFMPSDTSLVTIQQSALTIATQSSTSSPSLTDNVDNATAQNATRDPMRGTPAPSSSSSLKISHTHENTTTPLTLTADSNTVNATPSLPVITNDQDAIMSNHAQSIEENSRSALPTTSITSSRIDVSATILSSLQDKIMQPEQESDDIEMGNTDTAPNTGDNSDVHAGGAEGDMVIVSSPKSVDNQMDDEGHLDAEGISDHGMNVDITSGDGDNSPSRTSVRPKDAKASESRNNSSSSECDEEQQVVNGREGSNSDDGREGSNSDDGREGSNSDDGREGSNSDDGETDDGDEYTGNSGGGGRGGRGGKGGRGGRGDRGGKGSGNNKPPPHPNPPNKRQEIDKHEQKPQPLRFMTPIDVDMLVYLHISLYLTRC